MICLFINVLLPVSFCILECFAHAFMTLHKLSFIQAGTDTAVQAAGLAAGEGVIPSSANVRPRATKRFLWLQGVGVAHL